MEQISFIISDTATVNNLGLCRALIQAYMLARYLTTQNISTKVTYYLCESTDYSKFNQYLEELTDLLGLLPASDINTIQRSNPDDWPECNFLYYPNEHGLSPYALCKIEFNSIRSKQSQTVIEYFPLKLGSKSFTITLLVDKGFTTEQIRYILASFPMRAETIPIEYLSANKKLGDMCSHQSFLVLKTSFSENSSDKSAIASYHRKLGEISESFNRAKVAKSLKKSCNLFQFEQDNSCFSPSHKTVFQSANEWHLSYRYIVAAEAISDNRFPTINPKAIGDELLEIPVQVNGKVRGKLKVPRSSFEDEENLKTLALDLPNVNQYTSGAKIESIRVIPYKLISVAISN